MNLNKLSDCMHVLNFKGKPSTKNAHFSKPIPFTTIYLLQE
jgi:hypothetical protein